MKKPALYTKTTAQLTVFNRPSEGVWRRLQACRGFKCTYNSSTAMAAANKQAGCLTSVVSGPWRSVAPRAPALFGGNNLDDVHT